MALTPGTRLGVYEITAQIGEGGMGQVYQATDTTLSRHVAIKILPAAFASDPERLARFEREAKTLASLNHPHIAAIYGFEKSPSTGSGQAAVWALVMELVEGDDLSQRIARGALPIDEALPIAKQIADALEAAHEKGIVHRDLKPANIKITRDGVVKILDFGLAKALDQGSGIRDQGSAHLANSPTITSPVAMTAHGMILGTAAYMAPEQARGAPADRRADIWAFGVVLDEMLTGTCPFAGDTVTDVLAAVLTREVDWATLPASTPAPIRRLLRRCLEKDRKRRLADAASARLEIDDALSGAFDGQTGASPAAPARSWRWLASRVVLPTAAVTAVIAGGAAWSVRQSAPVVSEPVVLTIVPPQDAQIVAVGTMGSPPQLSPDGSAVMFQGESGLYVRRLDSLDARKVPGSEDVANEAFWHGSSRVTYPAMAGAARQLVEVRLPDGAPETIMGYSANVRGGSWSDAGTVMLGGGSRILTLGSGGAPASVSQLDEAGGLLYPEFLPGTQDFLALSQSAGDENDVRLATLSSGKISNVVSLFRNETAARFTPFGGGRVLFVKNDNLYSRRLNRAARAVEGEPELIVRGVASQPSLMRADFSVAANGTIAWRPGRAALSQVTVFDRHGVQTGVAGPPGAIGSVYLSPADESQLMADAFPSWLVGVGETGRASLPRDVDWEGWSPDGRRLLGLRDGSLIARETASGKTETMGRFAREVGWLWGLSPDGRFVLGRIGGRVAWSRVADMAAASAWTPMAETDEAQVDASFSPDGRFVLYASGSNIYAQPFPGPGRRQLIAEEGFDPVWRGDGKEIAFRRGDSVWSVAVSASGGAPAFGAPARLFGGIRRAPSAVAQSQGLAVSRDGSRFFVAQGVEQPDAGVIHVMTASLQRR